MRQKLSVSILLGAIIGFCVGFLIFLLAPILSALVPNLDWLAKALGTMAVPLIELGIHLICGRSPDIGCASGVGLLLFFFIWPLFFAILWMLIGAGVGLMWAIYREPLQNFLQKRR